MRCFIFSKGNAKPLMKNRSCQAQPNAPESPVQTLEIHGSLPTDDQAQLLQFTISLLWFHICNSPENCFHTYKSNAALSKFHLFCEFF